MKRRRCAICGQLAGDGNQHNGWWACRRCEPKTNRAMTLKFEDLRRANLARLPQYKNRKGEIVHLPDGSDWTPAQWAQAVTGEWGEYAGWRKSFERGDIDEETFKREAGKELADVVTYIDILAYRLGIDLGEVLISKFNEISERVGADVKIDGRGLPVRVVTLTDEEALEAARSKGWYNEGDHTWSRSDYHSTDYRSEKSILDMFRVRHEVLR